MKLLRELQPDTEHGRQHPPSSATSSGGSNGAAPVDARPAPAAARGERVANVLTALVPGILVVYTGFSAGGYFAGTPAVAAAAVALLLALRVLLIGRPLPGRSLPLALAVAALALFAAWVLVSATWSDATGRAVVEFDRALVYLLVLLLIGTLPRERANARALVFGLAAAAVTVCGAALISRMLPELLPTDPSVLPQRLSWPVTYWNGLGLLAALGAVLCLYLSCDERGGKAARILGAAALPVLLPTLLFTFSRGAIAAAAIGLVAFLLLARPRGAVAGLMAAIPAAIATGEAWRASKLQGFDLSIPGTIGQGHDLALVVGLCVLAAAVVRALLLGLDTRLARVRLQRRLRRALVVVAAVVVAATLAVALGPLNAVGWTRQQVEDVASGSSLDERADVRTRLAKPGDKGRLRHWRVALDAYADEPLHGHGAGTYPLLWAQRRPVSFTVMDGHSLYLETLAELGWVGLGLLCAALLALLGGLASRLSGPDRALYAALIAVFLAWALHAGIDWDWELPTVTLPALAAGAIGLAAVPSPRRKLARWRRLPLALGLLVLAVTPARMALSQMHLRSSVKALEQNDCGRAVDRALAANAALGARPEPFEVLGYCDVRLGRGRLGVRMLEAAVRRDPHSWEPHYGLAVVRAAAGLDPRPEAIEARRLNPLEETAATAVRLFRTSNPQRWPRLALRLRLPIR